MSVAVAVELSLYVGVAPTITDPGALSILEGASRIVSLGAEDADGDILSFSIISGDDQSLFTITSSGILSFASRPITNCPQTLTQIMCTYCL